MNIPANINKSGGNRTAPFAVIWRTVLGIAKWLIGFFTLPEADRLDAGVFVNSNERDESNV